MICAVKNGVISYLLCVTPQADPRERSDAPGPTGFSASAFCCGADSKGQKMSGIHCLL